MKEDAYRSVGGHVPVGDEDAGSGCVGSAEGDVDAGSGSGSESLTGMLDKMHSCDVGSFVEGSEGKLHDSKVVANRLLHDTTTTTTTNINTNIYNDDYPSISETRSLRL